MTEVDFEEMEQRERQAHDDKVKELQEQKSMTDEEKKSFINFMTKKLTKWQKAILKD